ncbi:MAG: hypothetical protein KBD01_05690 [Acidobacteria bacterium]|nr:hypothetical protein [Acidobacteriota bacterium]
MRGPSKHLVFLSAGLIAFAFFAAGLAAQPIPQPKSGEQAEPAAAPAAPGEEGVPAEGAAPDAAAQPKKPAAKPGAPSLAPPKAKAPLQLPTRIDPKTGKKVIVITNADLERIYGPEAGQEPAPSPAISGQPVEGVAAGEPPVQGVTDVPATPPGAPAPGDKRAELERLKKKALSLRNPFVPRVPQTEEEARGEQGLDNAQRVTATEKRIAELEAELAKQQGTEPPAPGTP